MTTLAERIVELHRHLVDADLPHAFGGALALAYCTHEPRGTKDIDVNVFIPSTQSGDLLDALPAGIDVTDLNRTDLDRDGQTRLWWSDTPVDVFLSNHPFHDHAESGRRFVPFGDIDELPVLACADLAVFKSFFARPKDAVDIASMVSAGAVELTTLVDTVAGLLGSSADRAEFFERVDHDAERMRDDPTE